MPSFQERAYEEHIAVRVDDDRVADPDRGAVSVDYLSFRPSPGILTAGWINPALKK